MKTFFVLSLLLIAALCKSLAQTNNISPELGKAMKEMDAKVHFLQTNERPIQTFISVSQKETDFDVCYRGHTNMVVYEPVPEQLFDVHLFSADGKDISKTPDWEFGQKLKPDNSLLAGNYHIQDDVIRGHERRMDFQNGNCSHFWKFNILKSFRIKEPGEYRLWVEVRLFVKDANGVFQPFILPAVESKVDISETNLK